MSPNLPHRLGRWRQDYLNPKVMSASQWVNKASLFCVTLPTFTLETRHSFFVWFPLAIMKVPGQHIPVLGPHLAPHVSQSCTFFCFSYSSTALCWSRHKDSIRLGEMYLLPLLNLPLSTSVSDRDPSTQEACKLHSDQLASLAETGCPSVGQESSKS